MRNLTPAVVRGLLVGLLLVLISIPGLFALHGALGLGAPPVSGLIVLGVTVALALIVANVAGVLMGESRSNPLLAALVGLVIGGASCAVAAPLYGGMVVDGLTHDAMGVAWNERERIVAGAGGTVSAVREGRVREELARLQEQARSANTPQARQSAFQQAKAIAVPLVKSSLARLSAFALLLWAIVAPPIGAAFECRRARR